MFTTGAVTDKGCAAAVASRQPKLRSGERRYDGLGFAKSVSKESTTTAAEPTTTTTKSSRRNIEVHFAHQIQHWICIVP